MLLLGWWAWGPCPDMGRLGEPAGFGRCGVLDQGPDGLRCHLRSAWHGHLGLHVWRAQGMTAAQYREAHGLLRGWGLVAEDLRQAMAATAAAHYDSQAAVAAARDPAAATALRLQQRKAASAQEARDRDEPMSQVGRSGRHGGVVVCAWCRAQFCPLTGAARRRFCSRSCPSRFTRQRHKEVRRSDPGPRDEAPGQQVNVITRGEIKSRSGRRQCGSFGPPRARKRQAPLPVDGIGLRGGRPPGACSYLRRYPVAGSPACWPFGRLAGRQDLAHAASAGLPTAPLDTRRSAP